MPSITYDHVVLLPAEQIDLHTQSTWELSYVISGHGMRTMGRHTEPFQSGEIVLVPPHLPHVWHFHAHTPEVPIENITITFPADVILQMSQFPEFSFLEEKLSHLQEAIHIAPANAERIAQSIRQMSAYTDARRLLCLMEILLDIALENRHHTVGGFPLSSSERRLHQVDIYIKCNYSRQLTLDMISRHVGMNRSAFCTWFKQATGVTFLQHLTAYRIQKAQYLLRRPGVNISQIAQECGFCDVPHFCRTFRKYVGCSASKYQSRASLSF